MITKTSGVTGTGEPSGVTGTGEPSLMATNDAPLEVNDSLTQELLNRTSATPAPHLSPRNLHFLTPDH